MPAFDRAKAIQVAEKHVRAGKLLEAVAEYKKLADDNPRDMNVLNKLGDLLARAGKNQEALRFFLRIAEFYAKDGFFLKAIAMYKKISKLDASNLDCQQQLATLYQRQGLVSEAKAQYLLVADHLIRKGQSQPAAEMLQKVLEIEPDNVKVRTTLAELLGKAAKGDGAAREYCQVARAAIDRGAAAESLTALRKAIHADAAYADLPGVLLAFLIKIDTTPKDLVALAEGVHGAASKSGVAAVVVAETYRRAGRRAEAEAAFKRVEGQASSFEDLSAEAMTLLARWHTGADRDAEAYEWLSRAVERFTSEARHPEAAAALDAYLKAHPEHRRALNTRAEVAAQAADPDAEASALSRLAPLLVDAMELDRAREVIERLGKLRPADPAVVELQERLQAPGAAPEDPADAAPEAVAEKAEDTRSREQEEARSAEEVFSIEEEIALDGDAAGKESPVQVLEPEPDEPEVLPEEAAYGPVSRIQEIQAADVDGQLIDEEFISEHLTEAEVFVKYGLLAKAREQLQAILERYPKEMGAHQRLIEVHVGEGNTELAVNECLLVADLKKAQGLDSEVRDMVNEAIRIAGPGSPLVERYTAGLGSGGAVAKSVAGTPAPKSPRPVEAREAPRPAAAKPAAHRPIAAAPKPKVADVDDLEIEIEMPEKPAAPVSPAAAVHDFAATTARSPLVTSADRVKQETLEDLPARQGAGTTGEMDGILEIDEPAGDEGKPVLSAIANAAPREPDSEKLGEVDFYVEQGLTDEARQVLFQLRKQYPGSHTVKERLQRLERPDGPATPKASKPAEETNLDFEVEQALGGRTATPEARDKDAKKGNTKPSAAAAKARPVFKVETHQPAEKGEFFDLAKEIDESLVDDRQGRGAVAPEQLDGAGHTFDEVLAAFRKGVEQQVDEQDYDTHYNLGIAYKEMGLLDEAIGEFQFAARDPARTMECCGILGVCFRDRGMPDLALKWYRRGLDTPGLDEQKSIGLRYDMAEVYREKGEYEQALKMFTEVYGVDSNYREVSARIKEVKSRLTSAARR